MRERGDDAHFVRGYLGFARLDTVAQTHLLNRIYDQMWLLHNFFHPVMRQQPALAARPGNGSPRSYDRPQPAFDRLCAATALDPQRQATLAELRSTTNPLQLRMVRQAHHVMKSTLSSIHGEFIEPSPRPASQRTSRKATRRAPDSLPAYTRNRFGNIII